MRGKTNIRSPDLFSTGETNIRSHFFYSSLIWKFLEDPIVLYTLWTSLKVPHIGWLKDKFFLTDRSFKFEAIVPSFGKNSSWFEDDLLAVDSPRLSLMQIFGEPTSPIGSESHSSSLICINFHLKYLVRNLTYEIWENVVQTIAHRYGYLESHYLNLNGTGADYFLSS